MGPTLALRPVGKERNKQCDRAAMALLMVSCADSLCYSRAVQSWRDHFAHTVRVVLSKRMSVEVLTGGGGGRSVFYWRRRETAHVFENGTESLRPITTCRITRRGLVRRVLDPQTGDRLRDDVLAVSRR